ncbi:MAG: 6-bladed beta-propeller [Prevotella sp.]|nr:6-bladed beta-propeller [Prevotella sp.]
MKYFFYICILGLCATMMLSCETSTQNDTDIKNVVLDVQYINEEKFLSNEFTCIEIIPLDNSKEALINRIGKMIVTDSCMLFWDNGPKSQVLSFKTNGVFENSIGRLGHAKDEYHLIMNIASSSSSDTIAIIKYPNVNLYALDGNFIKELKINNDKGTEDMLITNDGFFLGYFHRQGECLLNFYDKNFNHVANIIKTSSNPIRSSVSTDRGKHIQEDNNNIYCLDVFSSSLYVISKENLNDITKYSFSMPNMLTEEIVRNISEPEEILKYFRISSFHVHNDIVRGQIIRDGNEYEVYDFKFNISDTSVKLMKHVDMGYMFDCSHSGYFYQILSSQQLLNYMDKSKGHMEPIRQLYGDAIKKLEGQISHTDNYYIVKMKALESN